MAPVLNALLHAFYPATQEEDIIIDQREVQDERKDDDGCEYERIISRAEGEAAKLYELQISEDFADM